MAWVACKLQSYKVIFLANIFLSHIYPCNSNNRDTDEVLSSTRT